MVFSFPTGLRFVLYPEGLRLQDCSSLKLHPTGELRDGTGMRLAAPSTKKGKTTQETEVSTPTTIGEGCLAHRIYSLRSEAD